MTNIFYNFLPLPPTLTMNPWFSIYKKALGFQGLGNWCRHTDSNRGPTDYKSVALPTELCRHLTEQTYI